MDQKLLPDLQGPCYLRTKAPRLQRSFATLDGMVKRRCRSLYAREDLPDFFKYAERDGQEELCFQEFMSSAPKKPERRLSLPKGFWYLPDDDEASM